MPDLPEPGEYFVAQGELLPPWFDAIPGLPKAWPLDVMLAGEPCPANIVITVLGGGKATVAISRGAAEHR
jgi:hypothetical protein